MNKINKYFLMGTVALSGMVGFSACSSDDASDDNGKTPAAENGVVKTQFAINVPKAGGTRQANTTVQDGDNWTFRGLTGITLFPLTIPNGGTVANTQFGDKINNLGDFGNTDYSQNAKEYKVYTNVEVPIGTNHFVLYAQAKDGQPTTEAENYTYGVLNATGLTGSTTSASGIKFDLQSVATGKLYVQFPYVLKALNNVVQYDEWVNTKVVKYAKLRTNLTKLNVGSATAIFNTMQSLCVQLAQWKDSEPLAQNIIDKVKENFVVSNDNLYNVTAFKEQTLSNGGSLTPESTFPTTTDDNGHLVSLPEGVANIEFSSSAFKTVDNPIIGNKLSVKNLTYPASLYYFDDTELRAKDDAMGENGWPATATDWATAFTGSEWKPAVEGSTRTIALKENINYGVALMKLTAKCKSGVLVDNEMTNPDGSKTTNNVSVPSVGFPVTAVLVGGQPDEVDWQFYPVGGNFTNTVYDNAIPAGMAAGPGNAVGTNYTMLLDNRKYDVKTTPASATAQEDVYIVLELENNTGEDFNGQNGVVKKNAKFYVIGKVSSYKDAGNGDYTLSSNWKGKDNEITNPSIFMRDYVTVFNVSINSLKYTYNTIPDLRPSNLSLGMSVNLEWQEGFTFTVDM